MRMAHLNHAERSLRYGDNFRNILGFDFAGTTQHPTGQFSSIFIPMTVEDRRVLLRFEGVAVGRFTLCSAVIGKDVDHAQALGGAASVAKEPTDSNSTLVSGCTDTLAKTSAALAVIESSS